MTRVGSNVEILVGRVIEFMVSGGNTSNAGGKTETSIALNMTVNFSLVEVNRGVGASIGMNDGLMVETVGTSLAGTIIDDTSVVETEVSGGVADILTDDASVDAVFSTSIDARMIDTEVRTCVEVTMSDNTSLVEADEGAIFTSDPSSVEIEVGTSVVNDDS